MQITIAGSDVTRYLGRGSCQVTRQVAQRSSCQFVLNVRDGSGFVPQVDDSVVITDDGVTFFGGLVDQVDGILQQSTADAFQYTVTCTDWGSVCDRRIVFKDYTPFAALGLPFPVLFIDTVIADLVATGLSGEGITTTNVDSGALIGTNLAYHGQTVRQVLDNLSQVTGCQWYIDFDKDLHFKPLASAEVFPGYQVRTDNKNYRGGIKVTTARANYRNVQYVRSDKIADSTTVFEAQTAIAGQTRFLLDFAPITTPTVELNGVPVTVKTLAVDALLGVDWYWWPPTQLLGAPNGLLLAGDVVAATYSAYANNVVSSEDSAQIAERAAASGGSGRFEELEEVKGADHDESQSIANGLLRKYSADGYPLTIVLVNDMPPPEPGMLMVVNLPEFGIPTDRNLLVQQVQSQSLDDEDLGRGVSFRSTITLVDGEEQQTTAVQWFTNLVERTQQGQPVTPGGVAAAPTDAAVAAAAGFGEGVWFQEQPKGVLDGSNTVFTLTYTPVPQFSILSLNGAVQDPYFDYTLSGNTVTYNSAPDANSRHVIWYFRGPSAGASAGKQARSFAGGTDKVDYGNASVFNLHGDMSLGIWLKLSSSAFGTLIERESSVATGTGDNRAFALAVGGVSGSWSIFYQHDAGSSSSAAASHTFITAIPNDTWVYVGFSRDATAKTITLYLGDGSTTRLIETWTYTTQPDGGTDSACTLKLGTGGGDGTRWGALVGILEEHYIWSRALSQSEHQDAMRGSPSPTDLILDCLMGNSPEVDLSPTGASGTVTGTTLVAGH